MRSEPYVDPSTAAAGDRIAHERAQPRAGRNPWRGVAVVVLIAALSAAALLSVVWQPQRAPVVADEREAPAASAPATPAPPAATRYPVVPAPVAQPPLDMSDATLLAGLGFVFADSALSAYIEPRDFVRRVVATVDNIPRRSAPPARWPVKPAAGAFATAADDGRLHAAPANTFRYAPYVRLLESLSTARFVEFYRRHYPLFQQAYRELGYPDGNFNDRAVDAIDVLLATPTLAQPPQLAQPKVLFEYADRDLERLPAGQKLMLRIGEENAARVKAKLVELRSAITDPALVAK